MSADGDDLPRRKARLRQEVAARLGALGPRELAERGRRAIERLRSVGDFSGARGCLLYAAMPDEIDTSALIDASLAAGKAVFLPVCDRNRDEMRAVRITDRSADLIPGRFGILEPREGLEVADPGALEFVLVPGRAFDRNCRRLGRGRGFYDRFLSGLGEGGPRSAAVALDVQVFDEIPAGEHDLPVGLLVTETEVIRPAGN